MDASKSQTVSTTHFYNAIATEYDNFMASVKDMAVRKEFSTFFKNVVPSGKVLDFGGGTGLDLPWLLESDYEVYFCEPAEEMKARAEVLVKQNTFQSRPIFLESEKSDFRLWSSSNPPFESRVNAVMANFGVLNYVNDLPLLFEKFDFLLAKNGSIIANLLYANPQKLFTKYFKNTIKAVIKGERVKTGSRYGSIRHETMLYSIKDIQNAAAEYFVLKTHKSLGTDFLLLHLVKR